MAPHRWRVTIVALKPGTCYPDPTVSVVDLGLYTTPENGRAAADDYLAKASLNEAAAQQKETEAGPNEHTPDSGIQRVARRSADQRDRLEDVAPKERGHGS